MSARDDDDLADLLSNLETTLEDLRTELNDRDRPRDGRGRRDDRDRPRDDARPRRRDDRDRPRDERRRDDRRGDSRDSRRGRDDRQFDPPSVSDVLRFTNEYTIPTLIATLEATISALELFQKVVGAVAPDDSRPPRRRERRGPLTDASSRATDQLTRRLDDLRTALSETDLPQDGDARDIVGEARSLTEEIEDRVRKSRQTADEARRRDHGAGENRRTERDGRRRRDEDRRSGRRDERDRQTDRRDGRDDSRDSGPVEISVGSPGDDDQTDGGSADDERSGEPTDEPAEADAEPPEVDVEAELQSIKRDVGDDEEPDDDS